MMRNVDAITIPAAAGIDYTDADEIYGYHLLLCKIFERAGGFDYPPVNNATILKIQKQSLIWLREVEFLICNILKGKPAAECQRLPALADIPDLVYAYDFMYRISNGVPCFDYLRDVKLRTLDCWIKGDKSISETEVALLFLSETDRDIRTLDKRYSDYILSVEDLWIGELVRYGRFIDTTMSEAYSRLSYILKNNLFVYFGDKKRQDAIKTEWTKKYVLQDHTSLDLRTLFRYIGFILTANQRGYINNESEDELYCRLWSEYISRPEVNPFFKQALEIDLAKYEKT